MSNVAVNTNLSIVEYASIVNEIVKEYFDENGEYVPHFGRLNAMRIFYNQCVTDDRFCFPHDISKAEEMEELIASEDFIEAFCYTIDHGYNYGSFNFANAYRDALGIVEVKKTSINQVAVAIRSVLNNLIKSLSDVLTTENIDKVTKIYEEIASGKISSQSIADAVGNSEIFNLLSQA